MKNKNQFQAPSSLLRLFGQWFKSNCSSIFCHHFPRKKFSSFPPPQNFPRKKSSAKETKTKRNKAKHFVATNSEAKHFVAIFLIFFISQWKVSLRNLIFGVIHSLYCFWTCGNTLKKIAVYFIWKCFSFHFPQLQKQYNECVTLICFISNHLILINTIIWIRAVIIIELMRL